MKMVIDIPEDAYRQIRNWGVPTDELRRKIYDIIDNGTPLPKGHGRIIDESKITSVYYHEETYKSTVRNYHTVIDGTDAPTIIEGSDSE